MRNLTLNSETAEIISRLIESMETTIKNQNDLIAKLINENAEQENFINEMMRDQLV